MTGSYCGPKGPKEEDELHLNVYGERKVICRNKKTWEMEVVVHEDESGIPIAVEAMGMLYEMVPIGKEVKKRA